jgi:hypothetical protein
MEFLDRRGEGGHAAGLDLAVMLDADSEMSAAAVLRLVRAMEGDPRLALVQQLIVGRPAPRAFPRLFQFGMRAGMRAWATGQGWWQLDDGPYWGHNAIFRIAPFREHARLAPLPDGLRDPLARHGGGGTAARRGLARALPSRRGRIAGGQSARAAGISRARRALGRGEHAVPLPVAGAETTRDGALAARAGNPPVPLRAALDRPPRRGLSATP